MKSLLVFFTLIFVPYASTFAQKNPTELDFEKNRTRYTREHFSEGEDASSGFDYLFFWMNKDIVMMRSIWSANHTREVRVEDMYFGNEGLALFRRATARKSSIGALKIGKNIGLTTKEEMHFEKGKLIQWSQNGVAVGKVGSFWTDAEKSALETAKGWMDSYA